MIIVSDYCVLKKYQMKYTTWYGICGVMKKKMDVSGIGMLDYPWSYDAELEKLVKILLPGKD